MATASETAKAFLDRVDAGEKVTPGSYQFTLPIQDEHSLAAFLLICFGVRFPDVKVCENHNTPWEAFKNAYFHKTPVTVIEGSRGYSGKSHMMSVLGMTEAITRGIDVNILGGSAIQSERVLETMTKLWDYPNAPKYLLSSTPGARKTRLKNGAKIQALGASQAAVRGPHPNKLLLDEVDVMALPILDAAMGQPMPQRGFSPHIVMASTHQFPDGTFTEIKKRAAANGWYFGKWCYKESAAEPHGWLDMSIVDAHRRIVPAHMWASEYDLMEPSFEGRAIDTDKVNLCFSQAIATKQGNPGESLEFEKPEHGAVYATGADWAKENDWTVIVTFRVDVSPFRLVSFIRVNKRPWPEMVSLLDERVKRFPGYACHDATGVGNVVKDLLHVKVEPVVMSGRRRQELISEYISAIEGELFKSPRIEWMYKEHLYATRNDLVGSGHCPDSIVAGAMAYRASRRGRKILWLSA